MITGLSGWIVCVGIVLTVWIVLYVRRGPAEALGAAMVLSFAFPVWLKLELAGIPFNIRSTIAVVSMLGYVFHPRGKIISPLTLLDFCVGLIVCSHIFTDTTIDGFSVALPFRAYGEWALPYVAGRFAVRDRKGMISIAKWVCGVLIFLSVMSIVESLSRTNPFEQVFGERPTELAGRNASRLGVKRAFGTCMHPIYFGMLITVLTPWIVWFLQQSESKVVRRFGWVTAVVVLLGLLATVSRTPIVTYIGLMVILASVRYPSIRIPISLVIAVVLIIFAIMPLQFVDTVAKYTGGGDRQKLIEVDGKAAVVTGTRGRLLIWSAYADAMKHARISGYGSKATEEFPPRIPYMEGKAETDNEMKLVDNGYIVTTLRFGWLGVFLLVLLLLTGAGSGVFLYLEKPEQLFPAACAILLLVYAFFSLMLVSSNYDFAMVVLWLLGVIGGIRSRRTAAQVQPKVLQ